MLLKVCVPPHVLSVLVPKASEIVLPVFTSGYVYVEVAVHVGTPLRYASPYPGVPAVVVLSAPPPLPKSTAPAATFAHPVPPFATGKIPVTSLARFTSVAETAPATLLRNPENEPKVNEFDTV